MLYSLVCFSIRFFLFRVQQSSISKAAFRFGVADSVDLFCEVMLAQEGCLLDVLFGWIVSQAVQDLNPNKPGCRGEGQ